MYYRKLLKIDLAVLHCSDARKNAIGEQPNKRLLPEAPLCKGSCREATEGLFIDVSFYNPSVSLRLPPPLTHNVVNLRKKSCLLIRNQFLLAFSSGRRGTVLTVDEVFYSDCPVEHHNKSFSSENLTFSLVYRRKYNNSTPHL